MATLQLIRRIFGSAGPGERRHGSRQEGLRGLRVLVVDDSVTIRAVLGKMLVQDQHEVITVGNGESALALARERMPDLIFLDIVMPGMSGFSVLRALRHEPLTQEIPIVMISGNLQATEQFYVQRFGADDFMKKPFGRAEVFARIQHLTANGRLVLRPRPAHDTWPADADISAAEHADIPDIAMPDPHDLPSPAEHS